MTNTNPILAIDIDGVIRRLGPMGAGKGSYDDYEEGEQEQWKTEHIDVLVKDTPNSRFHRKSSEDILDFPVVVNLELHSPWLRSLLDRGVEIVWATTWEHQANKTFGPLLGLPELEVGVSVETTFARMSEDTGSWKARGLSNFAEGRPLIWLDDMNWNYSQLSTESAEWNRQTIEEYNDPEYAGFKSDEGPWLEEFWGEQFKHVAITTNPYAGLTLKEMKQVDALFDKWMTE